MKNTLFGKDNYRISESSDQEIIDSYKKLGIYPMLQRLFEKAEQEALAAKERLIEQGVPETEAEDIVEGAKVEIHKKILIEVRDKYVESFQHIANEKTNENKSTFLQPK